MMSALQNSDIHLPHSSILRRGGFVPATYTAYYRAVSLFLHCCDLTFPSLLLLPTSTIDTYLSSWLEVEYESGGSRGLGENIRHGLHFFLPRLRHQLHESHLRLRGWLRHRPSMAYPPIPRNIATLVAVSLARQGLIRPAVAVLLSFDCYLRVNECMNLRVSDVRIPNDERLGLPYTHCAIHLRTTKTIDNMSCTVRHPAIARLLHRCTLGLSPTDLIFPFTAAMFRSQYLAPTLHLLGLSHLGFVPHSFRHGGATHDYVIEQRSEEYVRKRGRWAATKSSYRYMQTLAAVDLTYAVPQQQDRDGAAFLQHLEFVMDLAIKNNLPQLPSLDSDYAT